MNEKDLIDLFAKFGYYTMKHGDHFSVFDRRVSRRVFEANSLDHLAEYAEILCLAFLQETLQKTIEAFQQIYFPSPVTCSEILPEETVTGEEKPSAEHEQEKTTAPVSLETEQQKEPEKDSPVLFTKICKGCGREFQTAHRQSMYCSPACYPSNKGQQASLPETTCSVQN